MTKLVMLIGALYDYYPGTADIIGLKCMFQGNIMWYNFLSCLT